MGSSPLARTTDIMKIPKKRRKPARKKIVQAVIEKHCLTPEMFFSDTRWAPVVLARRDAIRQLWADGAYKQEIAELIGRDVSIVNYHLDPENQKRSRSKYYKDRWSELKKRPEEYQAYLKTQRGRWKHKIARIAGFEAIRNMNMKSRRQQAAE